MRFRNAQLDLRQIKESHIMENVIYNELRVRGYSVDVGVVEKRVCEEGKDVRKQLEVDFVANSGSDRVYIQSALEMRTPEKAAQEKASLLGINDSFKKVVLVRDAVKPLRDERGVVTMSVFDFLLDENSLAGYRLGCATLSSLLSSTRVLENRTIPVNGETAVHHVDERPWKCTI